LRIYMGIYGISSSQLIAKKNKPATNSVYNQLLGITLRALSLWVALVYLDTESLWQRNCSYTRTLCAILKNWSAPIRPI
jgi:hypothetical protein